MLVASRWTLSGQPVCPGVMGTRPVAAPCRRQQLDFVRAETEHLAELAHLGDLGLSSPTLPEIDRLRLNADGERKLELRPAPFLAQGTDRLHDSATPQTN